MQIEAYSPEAAAEAVAFAARLNNDPAHHVAYWGLTEAEIADSLAIFVPPPAESVLLARENGKLVGLIAADQDPELGRAWIHGPFVEHPDWDAVAEALHAAMISRIHPDVYEHELYIDQRNERAVAFAERQGYELFSDAAILCFEREQLAGLPALDLPELGPEQHESFIKLHADSFTRPHFNGQQIIEKQGEHDKVFVVAEGAEVLGYTYVKVELEHGEGYTDFVGVAESAQRRGVGRQLLTASLRWIFSFPEVRRTCLTVRTENEPAVKLYEATGFACERVGRAFRKLVRQPVAS
ncbi:MAG TPA: GNAT family N-acetyltransferase [Herpetosiphonaceae bacterium]